MLDHISTSMRTMHIRLHQLHDLMMRWSNMNDEVRKNHFTGIMIELIVLTERVVD